MPSSSSRAARPLPLSSSFGAKMIPSFSLSPRRHLGGYDRRRATAPPDHREESTAARGGARWIPRRLVVATPLSRAAFAAARAAFAAARAASFSETRRRRRPPPAARMMRRRCPSICVVWGIGFGVVSSCPIDLIESNRIELLSFARRTTRCVSRRSASRRRTTRRRRSSCSTTRTRWDIVMTWHTRIRSLNH